MSFHSRLPGVLRQQQETLLANWLRDFNETGSTRSGRLPARDLKAQTREFVGLLAEAAQNEHAADIQRPGWEKMRRFLDDLSEILARQGFTSEETASFILSFKKPLFSALRTEVDSDAQVLVQETWLATEILDQLGLHTIKTFQRAREAVIERQREELLELSTPVVKLWDGILALPMIGTLDSNRTQIVMESLLSRIVETGSQIAIIDITGVPTVDTLVAQHLLKTVTAIRLMGAECIVSGVRPQIAQTIVHLGVDLKGITTKATLADALSLALKSLGLTMTRTKT